MDTKLKKFIEDNINYIEDNNYDIKTGLYFQAYLSNIRGGELTKLLDDVGINPLDYLDYVPWQFWAYSKCTSVEVPEGINTIGTDAFYMSDIKTVMLPSTITMLGEASFRNCFVDTIIYRGTKEEWMNIYDNGANAEGIKVVTIDGKEFMHLDWLYK